MKTGILLSNKILKFPIRPADLSGPYIKSLGKFPVFGCGYIVPQIERLKPGPGEELLRAKVPGHHRGQIFDRGPGLPELTGFFEGEGHLVKTGVHPPHKGFFPPSAPGIGEKAGCKARFAPSPKRKIPQNTRNF